MLRQLCAPLAAVIAAAILAAYASPRPAYARSTVAATAAQHCKIVAAGKHRSKSPRALSSVKLSHAQRLCQAARPRIGAIRFWNKPARSWTLYRHYQSYTCWDLRRKGLLKGPEGLCEIARGSVRVNTQKLARLDARIKQLLPQPKLPHDWLYQTLVCIHGGEGSWTDNTGNGYYGGLQMDLTFQHRYGADFLARWGTADNWPAWAQLTAAERAYRSGRGFGPWPKTGPPCAARFASGV